MIIPQCAVYDVWYLWYSPVWSWAGRGWPCWRGTSCPAWCAGWAPAPESRPHPCSPGGWSETEEWPPGYNEKQLLSGIIIISSIVIIIIIVSIVIIIIIIIPASPGRGWPGASCPGPPAPPEPGCHCWDHWRYQPEHDRRQITHFDTRLGVDKKYSMPIKNHLVTDRTEQFGTNGICDDLHLSVSTVAEKSCLNFLPK